MEFGVATEQHYSSVADLVRTPEELFLISPEGRFPWDAAQLRELAKHRSDFTVALEDERVVAFANLYQVCPNDSAFIGNVIVAASDRGAGLGKALMLHMIEICYQQYNAVPHLSVFNFNTHALLMYAQLGFVPYALDPRENPRGEKVALIHMKYQPAAELLL